MAWTDLSAAFGYGTKLTSAQMQQLRDNITALANGDSGAPPIQSAAIGTGQVQSSDIGNDQVDSQHYVADSIDSEHYAPASVDQAALKTSTGNASASIATLVTASIQMQAYCFAPNIYTGAVDDIALWAHDSGSADYIARIGVRNEDTVNRTYTLYWRYITATDEPFVYVLKDKTTGEVIATWMCQDPPHDYWGMDDKPEDFQAPIKLSSHPSDNDEIIVFKYPMDGYKELVSKAMKDKKHIHEHMNTFDYDQKSKLFIPKNLSMI